MLNTLSKIDVKKLIKLLYFKNIIVNLSTSNRLYNIEISKILID